MNFLIHQNDNPREKFQKSHYSRLQVIEMCELVGRNRQTHIVIFSKPQKFQGEIAIGKDRSDDGQMFTHLHPHFHYLRSILRLPIVPCPHFSGLPGTRPLTVTTASFFVLTEESRVFIFVFACDGGA